MSILKRHLLNSTVTNSSTLQTTAVLTRFLSDTSQLKSSIVETTSTKKIFSKSENNPINGLSQWPLTGLQSPIQRCARPPMILRYSKHPINIQFAIYLNQTRFLSAGLSERRPSVNYSVNYYESYTKLPNFEEI